MPILYEFKIVKIHLYEIQRTLQKYFSLLNFILTRFLLLSIWEKVVLTSFKLVLHIFFQTCAVIQRFVCQVYQKCKICERLMFTHEVIGPSFLFATLSVPRSLQVSTSLSTYETLVIYHCIGFFALITAFAKGVDNYTEDYIKQNHTYPDEEENVKHHSGCVKIILPYRFSDPITNTSAHAKAKIYSTGITVEQIMTIGSIICSLIGSLVMILKYYKAYNGKYV